MTALGPVPTKCIPVPPCLDSTPTPNHKPVTLRLAKKSVMLTMLLSMLLAFNMQSNSEFALLQHLKDVVRVCKRRWHHTDSNEKRSLLPSSLPSGLGKISNPAPTNHRPQRPVYARAAVPKLAKSRKPFDKMSSGSRLHFSQPGQG